VTLFDGSTCTGEGLVRKVLKKDMKDMIPHAVESAVTVDRKALHRNDPVTKGVVSGGVLTLTYVQNLESTYAIKSQLGKDTVFYLDHPRAGGHQLAEPAKAESEEEGHYRFRIELKAGETREFKIRERQEQATTVQLLGAPADTIRFYLNQRYLSDRAKALLEQLMAVQGQISGLKARENELAQERTRLTEDQTRIRENLRVLRETAGELEMRRKYLARLETAESRLEAIRDESQKAQDSRTALEQDLAKRVRDFKED
jgi:regulator of replication initiation timing